MMKIGIRAHDLGKGTIDEIATRAQTENIKYLQLVLSKAIIDDNGLLDEVKAQQIKSTLQKHNLKVAMLGAYFNPVHSDQKKVQAGIDKFKNHLQYASLLNCQYVGTETGSYNDDSWTYNPLNRTEEAYQRVLKTVLELCQYSLNFQSIVTCEGAYGHVIYEPQRLKRLVDDVEKSYPGQIKVIVDLFNYLSIENHQDYDQILMKAIELLQDKIVIFHLKDYTIVEGKIKQVTLGRGLFDYSKIIKVIETYCPDAYLIFEGIIGNDINESLTYIKDFIKEKDYGC